MVVAGAAWPPYRDRRDLLLVDRPVERLAELPVLKGGIAAAGSRVAVEADLVEAVGVDRARLDAGHVQQLAVLRVEQAGGAVDGAGLEVLHHRVRVGVVVEEELLDRRRAAPVAGVGHQLHVAVLLPLHALERPGADVGRRVRVLVGGVLARDLGPDVLGEDRHPHGEHVGLGLGALELHRGVVDGGRRLDALGGGREVREVVLVDVVVGEGDVLGRERLAVLPLDAAADGERPGLAVRRHRPVRGQARRVRALDGLELAVVETHERVVGEVPDLERRPQVADERVEVVGLGEDADLVLDRVAAGARRRSGRRTVPVERGRRTLAGGRADGPCEPQDEQCRHQEQDENRPNVPLLLHDPPFDR